MNKRRERALEVFLYVTFAIALFAGVGSTKSDTIFSSSDVVPTMMGKDAVTTHRLALKNCDSCDYIQLQSMLTFATNDDKVNAIYRMELVKHAKLLKDNPNLILTIVGHADSRGAVSYNQRLSEKRANYVYELLVSYGAPREQLIVDAYGETAPVHDSADFEQNRRVELQYSSTLMTRAMH
jgi:outer membrane protein OmpA-like peptidoglycan-associated protein